jgi:hypothetical protein
LGNISCIDGQTGVAKNGFFRMDHLPNAPKTRTVPALRQNDGGLANTGHNARLSPLVGLDMRKPRGGNMDRGHSTSTDVEVTIFVPCYNEAENIHSTLDKIVASCTKAGCSYEIIVIDDASQDATSDVVRAYRKRYKHIPLRLVVNPLNRGLAHNFIEAALMGCGKYYRIVCGDDVEPISTQAAILSMRGKADLVLPYPLHVANKTRFRRALSWAYTRLVNIATGCHLRYWNGCALLLRADVVRYRLAPYGFGFQARIIADLLRMGRCYVEIGCTYKERQHGHSRALTCGNFVSVARTLLAILLARLIAPKHNNSPPSESGCGTSIEHRVAS